MSIQNVSGQPMYYTTKASRKAEEAAVDKTAEKKVTEEKAAPVRQDRFEYATPNKPVTYSKSQLTDAQVQQLKDAQTQRMESFQRMLESMLVKQGEKSNMTLFGMKLNVTPADSMNAAASIAEGGEYSVDTVATRILNMAKALSGGDASKIAELRSAVQKGFGAAGTKLGGKLPGICQDTYGEVMKRFDDWENESKSDAVSK